MASTYTIGTAEGVIRITYDPMGVTAAKKDQEALGASSLAAGSKMAKSAKVMAGAGLVIAGGLAFAAKQASDFQAKMNLLVTAGGESAGALSSVSKGIEDIAIQTGTSLNQLADGMYIVEKAGKRGAQGLDILRAAAEGARAEGTDLATMTTGLTSIMQSYGDRMKDPIVATNQLVAASGMAKNKMQEFVNSLPNVLPLASQVGLSFAQVGGAIATLTQHGTSAQEATQELNNTIRGLVAPNQVAQKAMQQLGIDVNDLTKNVGTRGLTGSINLVVDAIGKHMGPAGLVVVNAFKQSQSAAEDLQIMLGKMPAGLRTLSQSFLDGKTSAKDYRKAVMDMGASGAAMGGQFLTLAKSSQGFNDLLKSGQPAAQTFTMYLKQIMGGATGMNTALQLSGDSAGYFNDAVDAINKSAQDSGKDISTWATTQKNAAVQMGRLKAAGEVFAVNLGTVVLPVLIKVANALTSMMKFFIGIGSGWQKVILGALGVVAALLLIAKTFKMLQESALALKALAMFLKLDLIYTKLIAAATKVWAAVQWVLTAAMDASPIGLIVLGIVALIAAVIAVIKWHKQIGHFFVFIWGKIWSFMKMIGHWFAGPFVNFFKGIGRAIAGFFKPVVDFFVGIGHWFAGPFVDFFKRMWKGMQKAWDNVVNVFKTVFKILMVPVKAYFAFWKGVWNLFWPLIKSIFELIVAIIRFALKLIWSIISFFLMIAIKTWNAVWGAIKTAWKATWDFIKGVALAVWNWISIRIKVTLMIIKAIWESVLNALKSTWNAVWGAIKGAALAFWNWIKPYIMAAVAVVKAVITTAWNTIKAVTSAIWNAIVGVVRAVWGKIKAAISAVAGLAKVIGGYFAKAYDAVKSKIGDVITFLKGIGKSILNAIGDLGKLLWDQGKKLIEGLINGIKSGIDKLKSLLNQVTDWLPDWKGPPTKDAKLLTPNGKLIMAGLIQGITKAVPDLHRALSSITSSIPLNVMTGDHAARYTTTVTQNAATGAAAQKTNHGPYQLVVDDKVLAEFVIDTVTGEPKIIDKTADEGSRANSWAGSGRKKV